MTNLVACLSTGKGTWKTVSSLTKSGQFEHVFLITNAFGKEHFTPEEHTQLIVVDSAKPSQELVAEIKKALENKIQDTEVALNLTSGSGKEHLAVLAALLQLGLGIRLVDWDEALVEL